MHVQRERKIKLYEFSLTRTLIQLIGGHILGTLFLTLVSWKHTLLPSTAMWGLSCNIWIVFVEKRIQSITWRLLFSCHIVLETLKPVSLQKKQAEVKARLKLSSFFIRLLLHRWYCVLISGDIERFDFFSYFRDVKIGIREQDYIIWQTVFFCLWLFCWWKNYTKMVSNCSSFCTCETKYLPIFLCELCI